MIPFYERQPMTGSASSTKGRNGRRSRGGCWTCRGKKVKCDEQRPHCTRCVRLNLRCDYSERPKLSERRRIQREGGNNEILEHNDLVVATYDHGARLIRSNLNPPSTGQCSIELGSLAHEAIRFFQTSFSESLHTKNPKYSLFSIMLKIAQDNPVVMHMAIAIALKDIHLRSANPPSNSELTVPIHHYSAALRLMTEQLNNPSQTIDLDAIFTALFLMLTYEEKFGDPQGQATRQHLMGAASILRASRKKMLSLPKASSTDSKGKELALVRHQPDTSRDYYSLYCARILTWMAFYDASAAAWGIGGSFNAALHECFQLEDPEGKYDSFYSLSTLKAYRRLEKYSNSLYRSIWGESYPQSELLDDVENRNVFALLSHCGQLRFMIAQLTSLWDIDREAAVRQASHVAAAIEKGEDAFGELMEVASELSIDTDDSQRLVRNIRNIVPFHYAAVLEFLRLIRFHEPLENRQRHALREIMNLAFQAFKHSGDLAMTRVAWPLFMAALETDDLVHRDWILQRFQSLSQYGQNFERAHRFLVTVIADQDLIGGRIDIRQRMKSGDAEYFVLTR